MRLQPIRDKAQGSKNRISQPVQLPAPTKGWYVGANMAEAPPGTAYLLQNVFPQLDYIRVRRGSQAWAVNMPNNVVNTIMPWQNAATSKMFAVCNGNIYDVTSTGAVSSAMVSGLSTSAYMQYVQFQGLGGSYLVAVNGVNSVQLFDGTGWNRTFSVVGGTHSNTLIDGLSSTTNLIVGQYITGSGIPSGTTITAVGPGAQITISNAATATASGVSFTVYQSPLITGTSPITGTTPLFTNVNIFKNRLYFVEKNSLNIWYLAVNAIGGAATVFPMQGVFRLGGYIVATASWSIDSTSGIYEAFVAISSEGEVVMYDGSDPSVWTLKGTYKISRPLGARCFSKAGGDLMIMTEDGIVPMSKVQTLDQIALQNVAITLPIAPAWRSAVIARTGLTGWQIQLWPLESMGIINLPKQSSQDNTQFIVNARTGAWSQYVGWDANCFAVYNNGLYYGTSDGRVMQAEVGAADSADSLSTITSPGNNYTSIIFHSFHGLNDTVSHKQMRMVHPYIASNFSQQLQVTANVDFDITIPNAPASIVPVSSVSNWDSAVWDTNPWPNQLATQNYWQTVTGFGTVFAPIIQVTLSSSSVTPDIRHMRTDILFEEGEIIA